MSEPLPAPTHRPIDSASGLLLVLFATLGGYGVLGILALVMLMQPAWEFSLQDVAFWAVAVAIPMAQSACRRKGYEGGGPPGSRASPRGIAMHFGFAVVLWAVARSFHFG